MDCPGVRACVQADQFGEQSSQTFASCWQLTDVRICCITRRVEDILHKDMRTNLKSFATWFHAYLSSPHRALLVKGETHLKRVIRLRKGSITTPMLEDVADEMRAAVNLWEQEPFHVGSVEYKRARLRMLRDIKVSGRWEEEIANGLQVSDLEKEGLPLLH